MDKVQTRASSPLAALVLSAGYGTRMGSLGKLLPKPLWPLGHKSLLEFVLILAQQQGLKPLWVNLHHQKDLIGSRLAKLPFKVQSSVEPQLLGSGGGVHQVLALSQQQGSLPPYLALLNSDQVVWFKENPWPLLRRKIGDARAVLLAIRVKANSGFNRLVVQDGCLQEIIKYEMDANRPAEYLTYLGMGLLNTSGLKILPPQVSAFFATVANFKQEKVLVLEVRPELYFDLGTLANFWHSFWQILRLVKNRPDLALSKFLVEQHVSNPALVRGAEDKLYYGRGEIGDEVPYAANLTATLKKFKAPALVLDDTGMVDMAGPSPEIISQTGIYLGSTWAKPL